MPTSAHLDDLTVALVPIRTEEPAAEFADRMGRLRQYAWEHSRFAHPSVDDLKTFATLGVAVHAHALAFHGLPPATLRTAESLPRQLASLVNRGCAWQQASRALFTWRSAQSGDPVEAEDLNRVSGLLRTFAPLTAELPELTPGDRRHLGQAIASGAAVTADIGRWNQEAVTPHGAGAPDLRPSANPDRRAGHRRTLPRPSQTRRATWAHTDRTSRGDIGPVRAGGGEEGVCVIGSGRVDAQRRAPGVRLCGDGAHPLAKSRSALPLLRNIGRKRSW